MQITSQPEHIKDRRAQRSNTELMMIETDAVLCEMAGNVLQKHYHFTAVTDTKHALDLYTHIAPDVLFIGANVLDENGRDLWESIIAIDPDTYVIMMSDNSDWKPVERAMHSGAKGYIVKPFTSDALFGYIDDCPTIALKRLKSCNIEQYME